MLMDHQIYSEKQNFHPRHDPLFAALWVVILAGSAFLLWAFSKQVIFGEPVGDNPASNIVLILLTIFLGLGLPVLMFFAGLTTELRNSGIFIRFRPFHFRHVVISFDEILDVEAITYSPLKDSGG